MIAKPCAQLSEGSKPREVNHNFSQRVWFGDKKGANFTDVYVEVETALELNSSTVLGEQTTALTWQAQPQHSIGGISELITTYYEYGQSCKRGET